MVSARAVYLCYFPMREPLVQTQVLPYLRAIVAAGVEVTLLTFEPSRSHDAATDDPATAELLRAEGIHWHRRRYHKRPTVPATLLDIAVGAWFVRRRVAGGTVDVLHARSHVPAVMAALGRGRRRSTPVLLFDMRGFMPEEYVDAGVWRNDGSLFRTMKRVERWLLREADAIVVLTERARAIVARSAPSVPVEVIPCCVDLAAVPAPTVAGKEAAKGRLGLAGRRVVVYVGSTIGFYLFDEMVRFVAAAWRLDPSTFFLVLTQRDVEGVEARITAAGLPRDHWSVRTVGPEEVAAHVVAADLALSFIPATYSKQASSPTKIAEYLACGVPVVATAGVGDIDAQVTGDAVGVLIDAYTDEAYSDALERLRPVLASPETADLCRGAATRLFDLATVGGPRYVGLYARLLDGVGPGVA